MVNWDRQYRLAAGQPGGQGFEVGETSTKQPSALHISFEVQKTDRASENTAKITLWNLNNSQLAMLNAPDCVVTLRAGYGNVMPIAFVGTVSHVETEPDNSDRATHIEAIDGRTALRDTCLSLSYSGTANTQKIMDDVAAQMGLPIVYSYDVQFFDISGGYSYIGRPAAALDKACACSGLAWSIQNGIIQVKKKFGTLLREVFVLSAETGLIDIPKKVSVGEENADNSGQNGYDVEYLMNVAIGVDDYVKLESKKAVGFFRVYSVDIQGDNVDGSWTCKARLLGV